MMIPSPSVDIALDNLDHDELNRLSCLGNRFASSRRDKKSFGVR